MSVEYTKPTEWKWNSVAEQAESDEKKYEMSKKLTCQWTIYAIEK